MADGSNTAPEGPSRGSCPKLPPFAVIVTRPRSAPVLRQFVRALAGQAGLDGARIPVFAPAGDRRGAVAAAFGAVDDAALELHLFGRDARRSQAGDCREVLEAAAYDLRRSSEAADPVVLMIDAEALPSHDWIAGKLRALESGADLVCGSPVPSLRGEAGPDAPDALASIARYRRLCVRLEDALDPVDWDPAPRHGDESGLSLAFRLSALLSAGGVPDVPSDLAGHMVARLRQSGCKIRHCPRSRVFVPPHMLAPFEAGRRIDAGLPIAVPDPGHVEQTFRHRARLRKQLERRYADLHAPERDRAVRSHLALLAAPVDTAPRTVPIEHACAVLRRRLAELGAPCSGESTAASPIRADALRKHRPPIW